MLGEIKFSKFIDRTPGFLTRKENIHFGRQIIVSASVGLTLLLQFSREGLQICPTSIHLEGVQYGSLMQYSRQRRKMLPSGAIFIALFIEPHFQLSWGTGASLQYIASILVLCCPLILKRLLRAWRGVVLPALPANCWSRTSHSHLRFRAAVISPRPVLQYTRPHNRSWGGCYDMPVLHSREVTTLNLPFRLFVSLSHIFGTTNGGEGEALGAFIAATHPETALAPHTTKSHLRRTTGIKRSL